MINKEFEAYKVKREIKRSGTNYEFRRHKLNEFGELEDDSVSIGTIRGLYHEENGSIQITTGETTRSRTRKIPMILCLYEDAASLGWCNSEIEDKQIGLKVDDFVVINGKKFRVTGAVNIQEWNIIADISLEVIDNVVQNQPRPTE